MDIDPDTTQRDAGAIEESEDSDGMYGQSSKAKSKKRPRKKAAAGQQEEEIAGNLHPDDPKNFLKLCRAIQILNLRMITEADLQEADRLLREYCAELVTVRYLYLVLNFSIDWYSALWAVCDPSEPPLRLPHCRLNT